MVASTTIIATSSIILISISIDIILMETNENTGRYWEKGNVVVGVVIIFVIVIVPL